MNNKELKKEDITAIRGDVKYSIDLGTFLDIYKLNIDNDKSNYIKSDILYFSEKDKSISIVTNESSIDVDINNSGYFTICPRYDILNLKLFTFNINKGGIFRIKFNNSILHFEEKEI